MEGDVFRLGEEEEKESTSGEEEEEVKEEEEEEVKEEVEEIEEKPEKLYGCYSPLCRLLLLLGGTSQVYTWPFGIIW
jgi:hypothetical protein